MAFDPGFDVIANLKVRTTNLNNVLSSLKSQLEGVNVNVKVNAANLNQVTGNMREIASQADKASSTMQKLGEQTGIAARRFAAFTVAAGTIISLTAALRLSISEAIKFQREMIRIAQVSGDSATNISNLENTITRLSKNLGVSSLELAKAATVFRQAGFNIKETADAVEVLADALLAPNFDNGTQIAETIVALKSQFKDAAKDATALRETLGSINAVAGAFAVEAKDIEQAIKRTGGAFAVAGGNINELIALFTSVRATTREDAESIATAFRTIFSRIQRPETVEQLKALGIQLRRTKEEAAGLGNTKLEGQFVGPYEAIRRLSAALKDLPTTDPRFAQIVEDIGGYRQISKVVPLIQQFATAQDALNVAQGGGVSLAINAKQAQEAYTVQLTKLKEELLAVGRTIVESPGFNALVNTFVTLSKAGLEFLNVLRPIVPLITALAAVKITTSLGALFQGFKQGFGARLDGQGRSIVQRAGGGTVPGVGTGDTVPAMLTPGEFVLRKEAVDRIGVGTLTSMNRGITRGFNKGGVVYGFEGGSPNPTIIHPQTGAQVNIPYAALQSGVTSLSSVASSLGLTTKDFVKALNEAGLATTNFAKNVAKNDQQSLAKNTGFGGVRQTITASTLSLAKGETPEEEAARLAVLAGQPAQARDKRRKNAALRQGVFGVSLAESEKTLGFDPFSLPSTAVRKPRVETPIPADVSFQSEEGRDLVKEAVRQGKRAVNPKAPFVLAPEVPEGIPFDPRIAADRARKFVDKSDDFQGTGQRLVRKGAPATEDNSDFFKSRPGERLKDFQSRLTSVGFPLKQEEGESREELLKRREEFKKSFVNKNVFAKSKAERDSDLGDVSLLPNRGIGSVAGDTFSLAKKKVPLADFLSQGDRGATLDELRGRFSHPLSQEIINNNAGDLSGLKPTEQKDFIVNALRNKVDKRISDQKTDINKAKIQRLVQAGVITPDNVPIGLGGTADPTKVKQPENLFDKVVDKTGGAITGGVRKLGGLFGGGGADSLIGKAQNVAGRFSGVGIAALSAASLADAFNPNKLDATTAVNTGRTQQFKGQQEFSGALSGAQIGAGLGSLFGPIGTVVGGVSGALLGFANATSEAEKQIASVKFDKAFEKVTQQLEDFVGGKGGSAANVNLSLGKLRETSFEKTKTDLAPGFFERELGNVKAGGSRALNFLSFGAFGDANATNQAGPSTRELSSATIDNLKQQFGLQLPGLNATAGKQIEDAVKGVKAGAGNTPLSEKELNDKTKEFTRTFQQGNEELLRVIAIVKGVPVDKVLGDFTKAFRDQAKAATSARVKDNAQADFNRVLDSVSRVADAFSNAAEAADDLARAHSLVSSQFEGTITATPLKSLSSGIKQIGGPDSSIFNDAIGRITSTLPGPIGDQLKTNITGFSNAKRILPSVLSNALGGIKSDDDIPINVREKLTQNGIPKEVINQIVAQLQGLKLQDIADKLKESPEKFAEEVTKGGKLIEESAQRMAQALDQEGNKFQAGLVQAARQQQIIETERGKGETLSLNLTKTKAQNQAERAGFRAPNAFLNFLSDDQLTAPFQKSQERLTGLRGEDARNPVAIANIARDNDEKAQQALTRRDNALPGSDDFKKAASDLVDFQKGANDAKQALRNLADNTDRAAVAQERLSKLRAEREGRNNLLETLATGDRESITKLNLGAGAVQLAQRSNQGLFGLAPELRRLAVEFLNQTRGIKLNGFGGLNSEEAKEQLLNRGVVGNKFGQGDAAKAEEEKQRKIIEDNQRIQLEAQQNLTTLLQATNDKFVDGLKSQFDTFFQKLTENQLNNQRNDLEQKKISQEAQQKAFEGTSGKAKSDLAALGITNDKDLSLVKANQGGLEKVGALTEAENKFGVEAQTNTFERFKKVFNTDRQGIEFDTKSGKISDTSTQRLTRQFVDAGVDPSVVPDVVGEINDKFQDTVKGGNAPTGTRLNEIIKQGIRRGFGAQREKIDLERETETDKLRKNFKEAGRGDLLDKLLADPTKLAKIGEASTRLGGTIESIDGTLNQFKEQVKATTEALDAIKSGKPIPGAAPKVPAGEAIPAVGFNPPPGQVDISNPGLNSRPGTVKLDPDVIDLSKPGASKPIEGRTFSNIIDLNGQGGTSGSNIDGMKAAFDSFVAGSQNLITALNNFPRTLEGNFSHRVEVIHNGAEMFQRLTPAIQDLIAERVEKSLESLRGSLKDKGINV